MLATLKLELKSETGQLGIKQSSNLQGVLMEQIDTLYAEKLHISGLNPYSQYLECDDRIVWHIQVMNQEAYEEIIQPLLRPEFDRFKIEKKDMEISIVKKELELKDDAELMNRFYDLPMEKQMTIQFLTPTSFKSNGHYVIIPDVRLIYQSLMNKYGVISDMQMFDEETLEQLVNYSYISNYWLKSVKFPLEGVNVPGFIGNITIRFNGPETLARYVRLLCEFGEYSGVGIKTAIGMGAMKIRRKQHDRHAD